MRLGVLLSLAAVLAACGAIAPAAPPGPPTVGEARLLLDEIIDAAIARDFDRLCAHASGTCDDELQGNEDAAPLHPPLIRVDSIHEPQRAGDAWSSGGVLFVLCGIDAKGSAYDSEVFVFDAGEELLATAAVFWTGTQVIVTGPEEGADTGSGGTSTEDCP